MGRIMYDTHLGREPQEDVTLLLAQANASCEKIAALKAKVTALRGKALPCGSLCAKDDHFQELRRRPVRGGTFETKEVFRMNQTFTYAQYQESALAIRARIGSFTPKVAMILGSGLGFMGDEVEQAIAVPYSDIPHFRTSTAPGHKGQLVFGLLEGQPVAVMQGRMHHYEGYSYEEVAYAVRVLRLLGCEKLIVTNAAGCVNKSGMPVI